MAMTDRSPHTTENARVSLIVIPTLSCRDSVGSTRSSRRLTRAPYPGTAHPQGTTPTQQSTPTFQCCLLYAASLPTNPPHKSYGGPCTCIHPIRSAPSISRHTRRIHPCLISFCASVCDGVGVSQPLALESLYSTATDVRDRSRLARSLPHLSTLPSEVDYCIKRTFVLFVQIVSRTPPMRSAKRLSTSRTSAGGPSGGKPLKKPQTVPTTWPSQCTGAPR